MHQFLSFLAYYVHNLDPFIFKIGPWGPRWYGVAYLLGFLCAYLLIQKNSRDGMLRLAPRLVSDLVLNCCIFGVLIGGRLGFCLFYEPRLLGFDAQFPFWGVLKVWQGGMSAHGGVLFTILTIAWFARKYRSQGASFVNIADASCMVVPLGLFFGRCANFINGELYGHPTTVPWAVIFPSEIYAPTNGKIDPAVSDKLRSVFDTLKLPIDWFQPDSGRAEGLEILSRRLIAHDPQAMETVVKILPARHPSQLYEALLEGLLLFLLCWIIGRRWRKDGMASAAFLTFYPIMRIIGEQFRVGDTPQRIFGMELSKGIVLSVPMFLAGAIYWAYFIVRSKPNTWQPVPKGAAESPGRPPNPAGPE
jgi:phosphatidylglycerol---prolipoprotein diacylglyceryl transferase